MGLAQLGPWSRLLSGPCSGCLESPPELGDDLARERQAFSALKIWAEKYDSARIQAAPEASSARNAANTKEPNVLQQRRNACIASENQKGQVSALAHVDMAAAC